MELNFTEIVIACTYFSTLCSKQSKGPRGSCQRFCVTPRRFNNKCVDHSFRDLQLTWCLRVMKSVDRVICGEYWKTTFPTWKRRLNKWKCAATERFEFWVYLSTNQFNCNLFTHGALGSSWELVENAYVRVRSNWTLEVLVFKERVKPEYPKKNLSEQGREPTTNLTHIMASTQGLEPGPRWVFFIGILSGNLFGEERYPPHPLNWRGLNGGLIVL